MLSIVYWSRNGLDVDVGPKIILQLVQRPGEDLVIVESLLFCVVTLCVSEWSSLIYNGCINTNWTDQDSLFLLLIHRQNTLQRGEPQWFPRLVDMPIMPAFRHIILLIGIRYRYKLTVCIKQNYINNECCLLYTSPSPRD